MFNHTLKTLEIQLRLLRQDAATAAHIQTILNTRPDQADATLNAARLHLSGAINAAQLRDLASRPAIHRRPAADMRSQMWQAASRHAQRTANRRNN